MRTNAFTGVCTLTFAAVLGLWVAATATGRDQEKGKPTDLPGAKGPVFEYIGKQGPKVTGGDVAGDPLKANAKKPPKSRTLPSRTKQLCFAFNLASTPVGSEVSIEVYDRNGKVALEERMNFSYTGNNATDELSVSIDCQPKAKTFADGPYQAKLLIDKKAVALVNWAVGTDR